MDAELHELGAEVHRVAGRLEAATDRLYKASTRLGQVQYAHDLAAAKTWQTVRTELGGRDDDGDRRLSRDYDAEVLVRIAADVERLYLAKAEHDGTKASVSSLGKQLTAAQSRFKAAREELLVAHYGPDGGP